MSYDFDYDGLDPAPVQTRPGDLEPEDRLPPGAGLIIAAFLAALCVAVGSALASAFGGAP